MRKKKISSFLVVIPILVTLIPINIASAANLSLTKPTPNPHKIILEINNLGGFVPRYISKSNLPLLRLYENKELIVSKYDFEKLDLTTTKLSSNDIKKIKALLAPFWKIKEWGQPGISDVPTTTITLFENKKRYNIYVYALGIDYGLTDYQIVNRNKLIKAIESIKKLSGETLYKAKIFEAFPREPIYDETQGVGLANPASVLCRSQGFTSSVIETPEGSKTLCDLPGGAIDEWENYRNVANSTMALPTLLSKNSSCLSFRSNSKISLLPILSAFLEPTGILGNYALRPLLPNEIACKVREQ
jgi:putative hemolysin